MKKLFLLLFALSCLASATHAQTSPAPTAPETPKPKVSVAKNVPLKFISEEVFNQELKEVGGGSFFLSNYRGQVFVVNLWATWCGPCRLEIPELNKLYKEYSPRGVEFIGLTTENSEVDEEKVRDFAREFRMSYKLGWSPRGVSLALMNGNNSIPQTFVVAADGRIVTLFKGYSQHIPAMLRNSIEQALSLPPEPPTAPAPAALPQSPDAPRAPETSKPPRT